MPVPNLRGFTQGLTSQPNEISLSAVPVEGSLPEWLHGTLVRNGPGRFDCGDSSWNHWFDGLAMLHSFGFADGRVSYANRYLRSPAYEAAMQDGRIAFRNYATDPCRSIFRRFISLFVSEPLGHNAGTNIVRLANRYMALTETPLPVEFDLETLETLGVVSFEDRLPGMLSTAHPHYDQARRSFVNYTLRPSPAARHLYCVHTLADDSLERKCIARVPTRRAAYMHSFGMTTNHVVLAQFPFFLRPWDLLISGRPFIENFRWRPEHGTRFTVIDKRTGRIAFECVGEPFFAFHHINAFEEGSDIVLDLSAYPDSSAIDELYLKRLWSEGGGAISQGQFRRYRLSPDSESVTGEVVSSAPIELPQIHYRRCGGHRYRFAYGVGVDPQCPDDFLSRLLKIDVDGGSTEIWHQRGCYPGEPIFVGGPDGRAEDDGVVLSVVLDSIRQRSFLLILDAKDFRERARAEVPQQVPFTFHGKFFSGDYAHSL